MSNLQNNLRRYRFDSHVCAFSTTRKGGYSEGSYGEFNINPYCGDNPEHVERNLQLLTTQLRLRDKAHIILPHQTHGTELRHITREFLALPTAQRTAQLEGIDGLLTNVPDICIGVSTADCVPIILYDTEHHASCVLHAGWRGTVGRIASKGIKAMQQTFGTNPDNVQALIGPAIMIESYEVGRDVWQQFADAGFDLKQLGYPKVPPQGVTVSEADRKYLINLPRCNEMQLLEAGLHPHRIVQTARDTYTHADEFFSARRLGADSGRIYTGIILRKPIDNKN